MFLVTKCKIGDNTLVSKKHSGGKYQNDDPTATLALFIPEQIKAFKKCALNC